MDWIQTKRRGPEWKQGWTDRTLASISAPPLPLMAVFAIVIFLLSLSQYASYKEQMRINMTNFKLLLLLMTFLLIFLYTMTTRSSSLRERRLGRLELARGMSGFPWGVAVLVVLVLVLISYQSSFQSKWFPFGSSD